MQSTLIKDFITKRPERSRGFLVAVLKRFWASGLEIPWPLTRDDLRISVTTNPRMSPANDIVKPWILAMREEEDVYLRLIWALISNHGWRPSHVSHLRWRNVQFDTQDEPVSIYAQGAREQFKTSSPIMAWLCPEVRVLLKQWRQLTPYKSPEDFIIPWRKYNTLKYEPLHDERIRLVFAELQKKHGLPKLTPKDLRHWTATACRKAGLSKQASAYLMGHDVKAGGHMRDWYDQPEAAEILDEQARVLPNGATGFLESPTVELVNNEGIPVDAMALMKDYLDGKVLTSEFANRAEAIKNKMAEVLKAQMTH